MRYCTKCKIERQDTDYIKGSPYCRQCRSADVARWRAAKKTGTAILPKGRPPRTATAIVENNIVAGKSDYDLFTKMAADLLSTLDRNADIKTLVSSYIGALSAASIDIARRDNIPTTTTTTTTTAVSPEGYILINHDAQQYMQVTQEQLNVMKTAGMVDGFGIFPYSTERLNRCLDFGMESLSYKPPDSNDVEKKLTYSCNDDTDYSSADASDQDE